jgi:antitoxin ParD1/3/4
MLRIREQVFMKQDHPKRSRVGKGTNSWYIYRNKNMARNTSVLLGEHFEKFIAKEVSSGRYSSASEVVRTALRLLESQEEKKKALRKSLEAGEKSGFVKNFDPKAHLKKLHKKLQ